MGGKCRQRGELPGGVFPQGGWFFVPISHRWSQQGLGLSPGGSGGQGAATASGLRYTPACLAMPSSPHLCTPARRYDIDALRAFAFALVVVYHVGMYYVADWHWHLKSPHAAEWLQMP